MVLKKYFRARSYRPNALQRKIIMFTRVLMRAGLPLKTASRIAGQWMRPYNLSNQLARKRRRYRK